MTIHPDTSKWRALKYEDKFYDLESLNVRDKYNNFFNNVRYMDLIRVHEPLFWLFDYC